MLIVMTKCGDARDESSDSTPPTVPSSSTAKSDGGGRSRSIEYRPHLAPQGVEREGLGEEACPVL
jgi:hypothetical protein